MKGNSKINYIMKGKTKKMTKTYFKTRINSWKEKQKTITKLKDEIKKY